MCSFPCLLLDTPTTIMTFSAIPLLMGVEDPRDATPRLRVTHAYMTFGGHAGAARYSLSDMFFEPPYS